MQSRNLQVPGDFSLGETVKSKKSQNNSTCKMFFLILFALKGHLPLNVSLLNVI